MKLFNSGNVLKFIAVVLTFAVFAGCSGKSEGDPEDIAVEMFAKAQEMQKNENFHGAIEIYRAIVKKHPQSRQASNSQFMIGYICSNHLNDVEQAKIELRRFLDKYAEIADSGLIAGAKFELKYMGKNIDEIPILSNLNEGGMSADKSAENPAEKTE